jgi:hypothetical protein
MGIGISALFGTLVTNVSVWLHMSRGLTVQEAYSRIGFGLSSPTEQLSLAVVCASGFFGGYVSAAYATGRNLLQGLASGLVGVCFFLVMWVGPANPVIPPWYVALLLASLLASSLLGGYIRGTRDA